MKTEALLKLILCFIWIKSGNCGLPQIYDGAKINSTCYNDQILNTQCKIYKDYTYYGSDCSGKGTGILAINCQINDMSTISNIAPCLNFDLSEFTNAHCLKIQHKSTTAKDHHEIPGNLKTTFPNLEKLVVWWNPGFFRPMPLSSTVQEWPMNLSTLRFVHLPSESLPVIKNSQVTKLEVDHDCPNLTNITNVLHLEHLEELEIDCHPDSRITELPPGVFKKNVNLRELDLANNNIQTLYSDTLEGLVNLTKIDLDSNSINSIPSGFFSHAPNLTTISWKQNKCNHSKPGNWSDDILSQENSKLQEFLYTNTKECNITMSPKAINLPNNNSIEKLQLRAIGLSYSTLKELLTLNDFKKLSILDLRNNSLEKIGDLKSSLPSLSNLNVENNAYIPCDCDTVFNVDALKKVI